MSDIAGKYKLDYFNQNSKECNNSLKYSLKYHGKLSRMGAEADQSTFLPWKDIKPNTARWHQEGIQVLATLCFGGLWN
jgi:hypothetical protein